MLLECGACFPLFRQANRGTINRTPRSKEKRLKPPHSKKRGLLTNRLLDFTSLRFFVKAAPSAAQNPVIPEQKIQR